MSDLHTVAMVVALILGWPGVILVAACLLWLVIAVAFRMGKRSRDKA